MPAAGRLAPRHPELYDIAVIGRGAAAAAASLRAAESGARVVVFDDEDELSVWGIGGGVLVPPGAPPQPFRLDATGHGRSFSVTARALVLCCGAYQGVIPFEGWVQSGVIGLTAAARLMKSQAKLPGQRVVIAGCGQELGELAAGIRRLGGAVPAVINLAPAPARAVEAGETVWLHRHRVVAARGQTAVTSVIAAPLEGVAEHSFACDALCIGHFTVPDIAAAGILKAAIEYVPARGGWVPSLDGAQRSSVEFLYIAEESAAPFTGQLAALAALSDLGLVDAASAQIQMAGLRGTAAAQNRRQAASLLPPALSAALVQAIPPGCVVCPCEGVTRAQIDDAVVAGARDLNQLKQFTRTGMGPCQGRICGEAAAELMAPVRGGRAKLGYFTPRIPLRPVPMAALLGAFDYADIPVPAAAPI